MSGFNIPFGETNLVPTYCSVNHVARMLGHDSAGNDYFEAPGSFPEDNIDNTFPRYEDIAEVILEAEEEIDRYTRTAFRPRRVINEYHTIKQPWLFTTGSPVHLNHRYILPFDKTKGDSIRLYLFNSTTYSEALDFSNGDVRGGDWWVDYENGVWYAHSKRLLAWNKGLIFTYRYQSNAQQIRDEQGNEDTSSVTFVPKDIQRACRLLAAAHFVVQNDTTQFVIDGTDRVSLLDKADRWEEKAYSLLQTYRELMYFRE